MQLTLPSLRLFFNYMAAGVRLDTKGFFPFIAQVQSAQNVNMLVRSSFVLFVFIRKVKINVPSSVIFKQNILRFKS
jgi:hypothetical protein